MEMKAKELIVLSLFDGMSCGQIALKERNINCKYYASEVDAYAIKQTQLNFPDTIQLGDVRSVDVSELPKIDLLLGGSPCTDLSFAGKQSGLIVNSFEDYIKLRNEYLKTGNKELYFHSGKFQQSILFWEYLRILKDIRKTNPGVKFLLENVGMKKVFQKQFNDNLGIHPVNINSNLVSAQNRNRWYWTNVRTKIVGLFGEIHTDIPQPKDKGILLKDILQDESDIDEKYYIKNPKVGFEGMNINGKNNALRTGGKASQSKKHNYDIIKLDKQLNEKPDQNKAGCLTAGGHYGGNHSDMDIIYVAMRGRNPEDPSDRKIGSPTEQRLEPQRDGKTNCLTSVSKDNLILQIKNATSRDVEVSFNKDGTIRPHRLDYKKSGVSELGTIAQPHTKTATITAAHSPKIYSDHTLRRLTPTECARLQTVPDWYKWKCSDTQQYKMLGNGWTVDLIAHILQYFK